MASVRPGLGIEKAALEAVQDAAEALLTHLFESKVYLSF